MLRALALSLLFLISAACASDAFSRAKKADTVESYRAYLREFPKDDFAEAAEERLSELEFERAQKLHTVIAYKRFLDEFPESAKATAAKALLEGLRFNVALAANTAEALRQFSKDYPETHHGEEVRHRLSELEFKEISTVEDPHALARFVSEHSADSRTEQAEARLDEQSFTQAQATDPARLLEYLATFPAGAHREEAKRALFSLKLEGLLFSGLVQEARQEARRSPLAAKMTDLPQRLARAEADHDAQGSREVLAQSTFAGHYLRSMEDLERSLGAPDPLDRWQAAEEMGQYISVRSIDPLLRAFRSGRNTLVRQHALDSLGHVLRALPQQVAAYEVAIRLEQLTGALDDGDTALARAALLDLSGKLDRASAEYQRGFDASSPDPIVLRRWAQIREERRQSFSAAVAARQLALWAQRVAQDSAVSSEGNVPLATARQLCAASQEADFALAVIQRAKTGQTEFPDDLVEFEKQAMTAKRLSAARLADAELLLKTQDPHALTCADARVAERLVAAEAERTQALQELSARLPKAAPTLLRLASERDPSFQVRSRAAALLAEVEKR